MKSPLVFKRTMFALILALGVIVFTGCAVYTQANLATLPVDDIIKMSKNGVPAKDIIGKIRQTHSVYLLPANELAELKNEGVQDSVINYMERTHIAAERRNQEAQDYYYSSPYGYGPYLGWGWGFGWPYGYWGWGPTVIIRGGTAFHGGHHDGFRR